MLCKFKLPSMVLIITSILAITGVLSTYIHKGFMKYESFVDKPKPPAWPLNLMKNPGGKQNKSDKPNPLDSIKNPGGKQNKSNTPKPPTKTIPNLRQSKLYKIVAVSKNELDEQCSDRQI
jgi:hypothetical protein